MKWITVFKGAALIVIRFLIIFCKRFLHEASQKNIAPYGTHYRRTADCRRGVRDLLSDGSFLRAE